MALLRTFRDGQLISETQVPDISVRQYSFNEFMDLFTEAEQLAIAGAAMTNVTVKLWYDRAVGADYIDLDDPRTVEGIQTMVTNGLLTAEKVADILS